VDAAAVLRALHEKYRGGRAFRVAIIGTYSGGRYVEPPRLRLGNYIFMLPFIPSAALTVLSAGIVTQLIAGVCAILTSYVIIYYCMRRACFTPDEIKVVRTNYRDASYLSSSKLKILEEPQLLPGDYYVYYISPRACVVRDKGANAFSIDGPGGPLIFLTTKLVAKLEPEEICAVVEHERGHTVYKHTHKLLLFLVSEYILRVYLIHAIYLKQAVLLLAPHLAGAMLIYTALLHAFEFEADRYAALKYREWLASALVKLDWSGIVESLASPLAARLTLLARSHPLTIDRLRKLNALPE
jgi:heat shock protein HtpX